MYISSILITYIFFFFCILFKTLTIRFPLENYLYYTYFVYTNNNLHYIHLKEIIGTNNNQLILMASINTLFDIIDKENTNIISPNEINAQLYNNDTSLNILFTNIRSIANHISELDCLNAAIKNKNHIIITVEPWLGNNIDQKYISLNNYQSSISKNHPHKSDGIVIFIQKDINYITTEFKILDANCMFTTITFNKINYGIISVYRSPSGNILKFIEDLEVIITDIFNSFRQLTFILIGAMNINISDTTNSTTLYYDLLNSFNFI